jgi:hypothetical protein
MTAFQGYGIRTGIVQYCAADEKAWYGLQVRGFGDNAGIQVEWQPSYGFAARPLDHDGTDGCQAFYSAQGKFGWLGHDPRWNDKCPPMTKGSVCAWNARGSFIRLGYDDEATSIYNTIESGARAHSFSMGADSNGKQKITLTHANAAHVSLTDQSVLIRHTGNGYIEVKGNDFNCNATAKLLSGLAVGQGAGIPLALATPLVSYLTALEVLLTGLATVIDAKIDAQPAPTPGVSAGAVTAFIGASSAFKAALVSTLSTSL